MPKAVAHGWNGIKHTLMTTVVEAKPMSLHARAGLHIPPAKMRTACSDWRYKISNETPIAMAATAECLVAAVLTEAMAVTLEEKKLTVSASHIKRGIQANDDLREYFSGDFVTDMPRVKEKKAKAEKPKKIKTTKEKKAKVDKPKKKKAKKSEVEEKEA